MKVRMLHCEFKWEIPIYKPVRKVTDVVCGSQVQVPRKPSVCFQPGCFEAEEIAGILRKSF